MAPAGRLPESSVGGSEWIKIDDIPLLSTRSIVMLASSMVAGLPFAMLRLRATAGPLVSPGRDALASSERSELRRAVTPSPKLAVSATPTGSATKALGGAGAETESAGWPTVAAGLWAASVARDAEPISAVDVAGDMFLSLESAELSETPREQETGMRELRRIRQRGATRTGR